jgi:hypothetical protein
MTAMSATIEKHHRKIITALVLVIVFFAAACTFHDLIPICHYLFGCDHAMHEVTGAMAVTIG